MLGTALVGDGVGNNVGLEVPGICVIGFEVEGATSLTAMGLSSMVLAVVKSVWTISL